MAQSIVADKFIRVMVKEVGFFGVATTATALMFFIESTDLLYFGIAVVSGLVAALALAVDQRFES